MSRSRSAFYSTIEYIGPRPEKPKRRNFFGGWVILVIAMGIAYWFGHPLLGLLKASQQGASTEQAALLISSLEGSKKTGDRLAAAALSHSGDHVVFDASYYKIPYPNGDVPSGVGQAADVIIRCYRELGIDLQQEVHEDMKANFRIYPQLFDALGPDTNIDHRRVVNLQRFFERKGTTITPSQTASDYHLGDIVIWSLASAESHIGIIVPGPAERGAEPWVVHNIGEGVKWENVLFGDFKIAGHFRYPSAEEEN